MTASKRRALLTKWIGMASWAETSSKKEMIQRSFKKCGISVAIDGSEDKDINTEGLDGYTVEEDDDLEDPLAETDSDVSVEASNTAIVLPLIYPWLWLTYSSLPPVTVDIHVYRIYLQSL